MTSPAETEPSSTPFVLWATLECGIIYHPVYGISLDGVLASQNRQTATPAHTRPSIIDGGLAAQKPATITIPLTQCRRSGKKLWHWNTTVGMLYNHNYEPFWTATPVSPFEPHPTGEKYYNTVTAKLREKKIFPAARTLPNSVGGVKGRYRGRRIPAQVYPAHLIAWSGVGDPDKVLATVKKVFSLGTRHTRGEGWVTSWHIQTPPDTGPFTLPNVDAPEELFNHTHHHPRTAPHKTSTTMLGRPLPLTCVAATETAENLNVSFTNIRAGLRPPMFHRRNKHMLLHQNFSE